MVRHSPVPGKYEEVVTKKHGTTKEKKGKAEISTPRNSGEVSGKQNFTRGGKYKPHGGV